MRNICLTVAYDGTDYHGFQRQPEEHGQTVQRALEETWHNLTGEAINITTAGRTDTGVHAAGQVVNFFSEVRIPVEKIAKACNSLLPRDIRVLYARDEVPNFSARRSARWKRYDYRIDNHRVSDVFQRRYALHVPVRLQFEKMREAGRRLEGHHNFQTFAAAGGSCKTFDRTIYRCAVEPEGSLIRITCVGDGFLYNMVRIIAGTLMDVGKGRKQPEDIPRIIAARERVKAGPTAPSQGLTLTHVHYGLESPMEVFPELFEQKNG